MTRQQTCLGKCYGDTQSQTGKWTWEMGSIRIEVVMVSGCLEVLGVCLKYITLHFANDGHLEAKVSSLFDGGCEVLLRGVLRGLRKELCMRK